MSGDPNVTVDESGVEQAAPEPQDQGGRPEEQSGPSWSEQDEQFARSFGWVPQDEFKPNGKPWEPADQFATRIRARVSHSEELEKEVRALKRDMGARVDGVRRMLEAGYKRQVDELKAKQREAVELGDTQAYDAAGKQLEEIERQRQPEAPRPQTIPELDQFVARNADWFNARGAENVAATAWARQRAQELFEQGVPDAGHPEVIERELADMFPRIAERRGGGRKPAPQPSTATVDGGSQSHAQKMLGGKREKGWQDLPQEARAEFRMGVDAGIFQDTPEDRQRAAKAYFS